jgi:hypothetical protein
MIFETGRKARLIVLLFYLVAITGCATSMDVEPPAPISQEINNPIDTEILSALRTLRDEEYRVVRNMIITQGATYLAASGVRCRNVSIENDSTTSLVIKRLACNSDENWFFSKDIFLMDFESD